MALASASELGFVSGRDLVGPHTIANTSGFSPCNSGTYVHLSVNELHPF
jgi:hypothetical protein